MAQHLDSLHQVVDNLYGATKRFGGIPNQIGEPWIRLLAEIMLSNLLSEISLLFLFICEHSGFTVGLTSKSSKKSNGLILGFLKVIDVLGFQLGIRDPLHVRTSAKNKLVSSTASHVAAVPVTVVIGIRKKGKASVDLAGEALDELLRRTVELLEALEEAEEVLGNGSTSVSRGADLKVPVVVARGTELEPLFEAPVSVKVG